MMKRAPPPRSVFRADFSAMRLDYGAADGEAQPDAGRGRLAFAAGEFFEYRLLGAGREAGAVVRDDDAELVAADRGFDADFAASRGVLHRVLDQVDQHPLEQHGVDLHQRQAGRQVDAQRVRSQGLAERGDGAPHHLLQRLPLAVEPDLARLQSGHVEQVVDQRVHAHGFVAHRVRGFQLRARQRRPGQRKRFRQAEHGRQRRSQVVGQGAQDGIAQAFRLDPDQRALRDVDIVHAFERDRDQGREGFQQPALLGDQQQPCHLGLHREHAARAHRRRQRRVMDAAAWQRVGTGSRPACRCRRPTARWPCRRPASRPLRRREARADGHVRPATG